MTRSCHRGWLTRLIRHLDDPLVGAVGPVTNRISNEAQIETSYRTYAEFERFAREYTVGARGREFRDPDARHVLLRNPARNL